MSGIFSNKLNEVVEDFDKIFYHDDTFKKRPFSTQSPNKINFCAFFIDGMVNSEIINDNIVRPMIKWQPEVSSYPMKYIHENVIEIGESSLCDDKSQILEALMAGNTIVFMDGSSQAIIADTKGFPQRSIEQPEAEMHLKGSKDGFGETLITNLALLRRHLQNDKLKFEFISIGEKTNTKVCLAYLDGTSDKNVLQEARKRLSEIKIDGIFNCNYIQECIKDSKYSIYKTTGTTEKPDILAAKLLEGRIGIMMDGSPEVLTVPYLMIESFQSPDDYYSNFYRASISRLVRIIGFVLSIITPAVYIALITMHRELLPTYLLLTVTSARQGVPFPTVLETLILLFCFNILQEAGSRIPSNVGTSLSIVGALVLGQAAVEARFVSAPVVIIVAFAGATSLMVPKLMNVMFVTRLFLILMASTFGIFGIIIGGAIILLHVSTLKSFGVPCVAEYTEGYSNEDLFVRFPWTKIKKDGRFVAKDRK